MPMPMQPPGMGGGPPPPGGGVNAMAAQDMAGRMGGPPPGAGGDIVGQAIEMVQQAVLLTTQAGPEAWIMGGLGEAWKGAIATLDKMIKPQGAGGPQGPGPGGQGMPPGPPGGMAPPPGPQMPGPMG